MKHFADVAKVLAEQALGKSTATEEVIVEQLKKAVQGEKDGKFDFHFPISNQ